MRLFLDSRFEYRGWFDCKGRIIDELRLRDRAAAEVRVFHTLSLIFQQEYPQVPGIIDFVLDTHPIADYSTPPRDSARGKTLPDQLKNHTLWGWFAMPREVKTQIHYYHTTDKLKREAS
jgi:hypothetical protein